MKTKQVLLTDKQIERLKALGQRENVPSVNSLIRYAIDRLLVEEGIINTMPREKIRWGGARHISCLDRNLLEKRQ